MEFTLLFGIWFDLEYEFLRHSLAIDFTVPILLFRMSIV